MIIRATAIPLAVYPYSSTSRIVHWLTRRHGKVSTLLKGALRPKSPFLGEYELFSTSELLYFAKRADSLHTGKECSMLYRRDAFRTDWRAMQTASYLTALINKTTPDEAPHPELFEFYESLLDFSAEYGGGPQFIAWAELQFCTHHGHAPNFGKNCVLCGSGNELRFCASTGGVVCAPCSKAKKLPFLVSPPDVLAILRAWQHAGTPGTAVKTSLSGPQLTAVNAIASTFMKHHFNMRTEPRNAALQSL
ncbi:DNA repair protein RecO [Pontiella sulfatireligans]|uniref:DNA repair protein RecO n=1 Tax=Pontiella sulfatireligans TaxID=2750658 RepID=A0A6C2UCY6_9BACT|nr:DNA repair protein RecO [Pontiella sulfatireligans]VGO18048.1 DNA repair protein RecO [Pontiella sulfatireligans]